MKSRETLNRFNYLFINDLKHVQGTEKEGRPLRRQVLYPTELRARSPYGEAASPADKVK